MAKVNSVQTNFTSGEISPAMRGRVDNTRYFNGAKKIQNAVVKPQGGAYRRHGTRFVLEVYDSTKETVIRTFSFSNDESYVIEFDDNRLRIFKDGVKLSNLDGLSNDYLTTVWNDVHPTSGRTLRALSFAQSADVLYIAHPDHPPYTLSRYSDTDWRLAALAFEDGPYLDPNEDDTKTIRVIDYVDTVTVTASAATFGAWSAGNLFELKVGREWRLLEVVSVTSSTVVVAKYRVPIVEGIAPEDGVFWNSGDSEVQAWNSGTFTRADLGKYIRWRKHDNLNHNLGDEQSGTITGTPFTNVTGGWALITGISQKEFGKQLEQTLVTDSATFRELNTAIGGGTLFTVTNRTRTATLIASSSTFASTDVGRWVRVRFGSSVFACKITAYVSATEVDVEPVSDMVYDPEDGTKYYNGGVSDDWSLGSWSDTIGWPSLVTFQEQRLVFARTDEQPQTIWMSETDDFPSFRPTEYDGTVLDTNAINYTLSSYRLNEITWMKSGPVLLVGTKGAEWQTKASSISEPLTPTNIMVTQQTAYGSPADIPAERIGTATLHLEVTGRKLRELVYNFEIDSFASRDLTIISEHILRDHDGPVELAYQQGEQSTVWIVADDGVLIGLTYERDQEVIAWHRHSIGGSGIVESIATLPPTPNAPGQLYMVVKRTIGGGTKRYIERLMPDFDPDGGDLTTTGMFYLDSHVSYSGGATTTITGLAHLNGETVGVLANGHYKGTAVPSGGSITLAQSATNVQVGYNYNTDIELMPVETSAIGPGHGRVARITDMVVNLVNSLNFTHGRDTSNLLTETIDSSTTPALVTENRRFAVNADYTRAGGYVIRQAEPYPLNILAVSSTLDINQT